METKNKIEFVDGLWFNLPSDKSPDFVKGKLSVLVDKFIPYLQSKANAKGYVNLDLLVSKSGAPYVKLNEWKPEEKFITNEDGNGVVREPNEMLDDLEDTKQIKVDDIPF